MVSTKYIVRRIVNTFLVIAAATLISFIIPRLAPGDPVDLLQQTYGLSNEEAEAIRARLGLRGSLWDQFIAYIASLARLDLGYSFTYNMRPVVDVIASALPWSVLLLSIVISLRVIIGITLGMISAARQGGKLDTVLSSIMSFILSMPYFLLALVFLYIFGVKLGVFPISHAYSYEYISKGFSIGLVMDVLTHSALPIITLVLIGLPHTYYVMKNNMIAILKEDFVLVMRAKGLKESRIMWNVARNAILPVVTSTAISIGYIVVGAVIAEAIFSYPGMGYVFINAILNKDYPLIQGVFLLLSITVSLANLTADLLYMALDPRVRVK
ncbi:MAG: ABC transporter permease [Sulfolobales archaeon]